MELFFYPLMVPAEKIIGPGRGSSQVPVAGGDISILHGFFLPIGLQALVGADVDALFLARENLAPPLVGPAALAVEKKFGALGLGAKEGKLGESAVPAPLATG